MSKLVDHGCCVEEFVLASRVLLHCVATTQVAMQGSQLCYLHKKWQMMLQMLKKIDRFFFLHIKADFVLAVIEFYKAHIQWCEKAFTCHG